MSLNNLMHAMLLELRQYRIFIRRWGWLMLAGALITAGGSVIAERASPPVYQATATIVVNTINLQALNPWKREATVVSLVQPVIESDAVLGMVLLQYPQQTIAHLRNNMIITSPASAESTLPAPPVNIVVSNKNPTQAAQFANAIAQAVIDFYNNEAQTYYQPRAITLQAQENHLQQQITKAQRQLQTAQHAPLARAQVSALQSNITSAQEQYKTLDAERSLAINQQTRRQQGWLTWLTHAHVPATPANRQLLSKSVLFAGLAGLGAGGIVALLLAQMTQLSTSRDDATR